MLSSSSLLLSSLELSDTRVYEPYTRALLGTDFCLARAEMVGNGPEVMEALEEEVLPPPAPPWSRVEGKSQVHLQQMPPLRGGICMGVD